MKKTMLIVAHPAFDEDLEFSKKSIMANEIINHLKDEQNIDIRILEEGFNPKEEREILEKYDKVVFHSPWWWYSVSYLLKEYFDKIFIAGYAYPSMPGAEDGEALKDKEVFLSITLGNREETYQPGEFNGDTFESYIIPVTQTFRLPQMNYKGNVHSWKNHAGFFGEVKDSNVKIHVDAIKKFANE